MMRETRRKPMRVIRKRIKNKMSKFKTLEVITSLSTHLLFQDLMRMRKKETRVIKRARQAYLGHWE